MTINWYPGHMHKATKEIKELLPKIDVFIEVLDARIPYSSENPVINKLRENKPCIKLLSKSDLADKEITELWIQHFENEYGVKAMPVSNQEPEKIKQILTLCKKLAPHKKDSAEPVYALITGIPNVGKSTLINILAGKMIAKTGNEPAITKGQQFIKLDNGIMLIDSPGILWPKVNNENSAYRLATTGAIRETAMNYEDVAFFAATYLLNTYPELIKQRYKLQELPKTEIEFLERIGKQRGCLESKQRVNLDKISRIFLGELRDKTIGAISLEIPNMAEQEKLEVEAKLIQIEADKKEKKENKRGKRIKSNNQ